LSSADAGFFGQKENGVLEITVRHDGMSVLNGKHTASVGKERKRMDKTLNLGNQNENIVWHSSKVSYEKRCEVLGQSGLVVWFTGLSGSGKSTIAVELERLLNEAGKAVYLLDGDNIRCGINSDLGFTDEDRNENIRRISEIAALFRDAGLVTLVSFISPFREMRQFARERAGTENFIEVYVDTDFETCRQRDPKGLYKKQIQNFTGKDSSYEPPLHPELVLDTIKYTPSECAKQVFEVVQKRLDTHAR
jgi:adenylylsulfate kinase